MDANKRLVTTIAGHAVALAIDTMLSRNESTELKNEVIPIIQNEMYELGQVLVGEIYESLVPSETDPQHPETAPLYQLYRSELTKITARTIT